MIHSVPKRKEKATVDLKVQIHIMKVKMNHPYRNLGTETLGMLKEIYHQEETETEIEVLEI